MDFRINRQIRALKVRLIGADGSQIGIVPIKEALTHAETAGLDLVEIAPNASPPVCKIIDYGKFRYDQTKREKESKKAQHQIKVKEVKLKPNIDEHDFLTKAKQARSFLEKGYKVKISCIFRGREMSYPQLGEKVVQRFCKELEDTSQIEAPPKMLGKNLFAILAPYTPKKIKAPVAEMKKSEES